MHVASRSTVVKGAIVNADIVEGLAASYGNSGTVNGVDTNLITASAAASGLNPVYVIAAAPDDFQRPVDIRQYRAGWVLTNSKWSNTGYVDPVTTNTLYEIGISNLANPTIPSGFRVNLHRGGTYTVPSDCYVDSTGIKVPGNYIEVGANSKWQYTALRTNAVGQVVHYRSDDQSLTFELWD